MLSNFLTTLNIKCNSLRAARRLVMQIPLLFSISDIIKSGIGLAIWIAGLVTWIVIFQNNRAAWGAFGDQISFLIPLGRP